MTVVDEFYTFDLIEIRVENLSFHFTLYYIRREGKTFPTSPTVLLKNGENVSQTRQLESTATLSASTVSERHKEFLRGSFRGNNFPRWKRKLKSPLRSKGLFDP